MMRGKLLCSVLALLLPLSVLSTTTQVGFSATTAEQTACDYDAVSVLVVPDNAATVSEASPQPVPSFGPITGFLAANTPRLFHYTDSAGAAGIRASGRTLIPGEAAGGKVWATTITPEQMFGPAGWFHRLRVGGGVNFELGGPLGIRYSGTTKFTRYFEVADPSEFSRAWIPEPYKGVMGQFVKEGAAVVK